MLLPLELAIFYLPIALAAETRSDSRPRGVSPEFAKFYKSTDNHFTCISNPTFRIPLSQVNDDYCDCPDGSDEPGTAACTYLSRNSYPQPKIRPGAGLIPQNETLALPGFYCKNKGHNPAYLRFENVNDGVCDYDVCCDGSDEYGGLVKCEDRCAALGKEWKKAEEVRNKSQGRAMNKRKELQFEADRRRKEVEEKIQATKIKIEGFQRKVVEMEENLKEVERREKVRLVKTDASGKGQGRLGVLLNLAKDRTSELRGALTKLRKQRDDMVERVKELETLLSALKEDHNPNFNDAGVKSAVQGWEDYAARDSQDTWTDAEDRDLTEIAKEDGSDSGINWTEFEDGEVDTTSDAAAIYSLTSYLPPALQSWLTGSIGSLRQILVDNGILPDTAIHANLDDSPAVKEARKSRDDTKRDLTNAENDLKRDEEDLNRDYGPGGIFRALKDQCVEVESGEYKYSHCFMHKTTQQPKKGGGQTIMGNFVGFETEHVDDDLPTGGKGLGRGERVVMRYENGQHCWNGPARSTRLVLACSENDEIWKVSESEKCVYRMEVGSPAVCGWEGSSSNDSSGQAEQRIKDEL